MPAKSNQQQKFFGIVKAMQDGDIPKEGEAGEVADNMTKKEVEKMTKVKEQFKIWKLTQLDQVAKMKLKGKIDNIDKAGLLEALDAKDILDV